MLVLSLTILLVLALIALYRLWKRVKHEGEDEINMTRSHVTQCNFPDNRMGA